jgi:uncharacterized phiE125 gp8 family phage protein
MNLTELTQISDAQLPVAAFRAHLRLGAGFDDTATEDAMLAQYLRAALAVVEARTGKALITRNFLFTTDGWRWPDRQALPIAPVTAVTQLAIRSAEGALVVIDPARWAWAADAFRPALVARGAILPPVPRLGRAEITLSAGFGLWADLPADLAQAVMLLAAQYYDARAGGAEPAAPVVALMARWRGVQITAGGHRG